MAENVVEIVVRSKNLTRAGFESAKRDAAEAGDQAGQSFSSRFIARMLGGFGGFGGGGAGGAGAAGAAGGAGPWGAVGAGIGVAIGAALLPALAGTVATLGVGGLGILAALKIDKASPAVKAFAAAFADVQKVAGQAFLPVLNQLAQFGTSLAGPIGALFKSAAPGFLSFFKALEPAIRQVIPMLAQFITAFAPFAGSIGKSVGLVLVDIVKGLRNLEPAFRASAQIVHLFADIVGGAIAFVGRVIGNGVRIVYDLVTGRWRDAWRTAGDLVRYAITGLSDQLFKLVIFIVSRWLPSVINAVTLGLGRLAADMIRIGEHIIGGLLHGLESAAGGVLSWAEHFAGSIGGVFSRALHILSPSKVFEEHGRNIVRGLVAGLQGEAPNALAAIAGLGASLSPGAMAGGHFPALAGGGGIGGSPGRLDIYLHTDGPELMKVLRAEIRHVGGASPNSVQIALGRRA